MSSSRNYFGKSRNVPTKVRRRQSDAKWRASVQSCYESLKLIIPESRRLNKRKLSKALILQETENHTLYLEDVLRTLLEEKQKLVNHGMIHPAKNSPHTFQEVKDIFVKKTQIPLAQIPKPRRLQPRILGSQVVDETGRLVRNIKDPSSPGNADRIVCRLFQGDQYYYLSGQTLCLKTTDPKSESTIEGSHLASGGSRLPLLSHLHTCFSTSTSVTNSERKENFPPCSPLHPDTRISGSSEHENPRLSFLLAHTPSLAESMEDVAHEVYVPQLTPSKSPRTCDLGKSLSQPGDLIGRSPSQPGEINSARSPWWSSTLSSIQHHPAFLTPSKVTRKLPFDCGTPTRVSSELKSVPCSPVTSFNKEASFPLQTSGDDSVEVPCTPDLKSEEYELEGNERDDSGSLLCTESIDSMELGDEVEWLRELQLRERKKYGQASKKVLQTPCQEQKGEIISCRPSEMELQDSDGCTSVLRTSCLGTGEHEVFEGGQCTLEMGRNAYKVEILKLADVKADLNAFEKEWETSPRSEAIAQTKGSGKTGGYLSVQPTEIDEDLHDDTFLNLFNATLPEIMTPVHNSSNEDIKEDMRVLYERQDVIIENTTKILEMITGLDKLLNYKVAKKSSAYKRLHDSNLLTAQKAKVPRMDEEPAPLEETPQHVYSELAIVPQLPEPQPEQPNLTIVTISEPTTPNPFPIHIPSENPVQHTCPAPIDDLQTINIADLSPQPPNVNPVNSLNVEDFYQPYVKKPAVSFMNIGSTRNPLLVDRIKFLRSAQMPTPVRFILSSMDLVFTNQEMSSSNIDGGVIKYGGNVLTKDKLSDHKLTTIFRQAATNYGVNEDVLRSNMGIRNSINAKCRAKRQAALREQL